MSRRWGSRRTELQPASAEDLTLLLKAAESREAALKKQLTNTETQLRWHKIQLSDTESKTRVATLRADELDLELAAVQGRLDKVLAGGGCSCSADVKAMHATMTALEKRVRELQRVNEGYEAEGWLPRAMQAKRRRG